MPTRLAAGAGGTTPVDATASAIRGASPTRVSGIVATTAASCLRNSPRPTVGPESPVSFMCALSVQSARLDAFNVPATVHGRTPRFDGGQDRGAAGADSLTALTSSQRSLPHSADFLTALTPLGRFKEVSVVRKSASSGRQRFGEVCAFRKSALLGSLRS